MCSATSGPGPATILTTLVLQLSLLFSGVSVPGNQLDSWLLGFYYISPARWALEGLISTQFQNYNDVMCYPVGIVTTYAVGASPKFCTGTSTPPFYLPDVNVTACCNPSTSLPISARNYVLYGQTYSNNGTNVTIPAFLGGPNGFQFAFRYVCVRGGVLMMQYDLLYVAMIVIGLRMGNVVAATLLSFQKR